MSCAESLAGEKVLLKAGIFDRFLKSSREAGRPKVLGIGSLRCLGMRV